MKDTVVIALLGALALNADAKASLTANISYIPNEYDSVLFEIEVVNDSDGDIWVPKDQFCKLYADNFIIMSDAGIYFEKEYPTIESMGRASEGDKLIFRNVKISKGTRFTCSDDDLETKYSLSEEGIKYYYFQFFIKNILINDGGSFCELRSNVIKLDMENNTVKFDFSFDELIGTEFKAASLECD